MAHRRLSGAVCLLAAIFDLVGGQSIEDYPKAAMGGLSATGGLMATALGGGGPGIATVSSGRRWADS
jgi:hypothetical protein